MRGLRLRAAGAVLASVLLLSGCSSAPQGIDEGTAQTLDDAVVAVAEKASADDYQGALTELASLQSALDAALAEGSVSSDRAATVQAQVDVVRGDLEALIAGAPEPAPAETTAPAPEVTTPVEEEPEDTPAPVETEDDPAPSPEESEPEETPTEPEEPAEEIPAAPGDDAPGNSGDAPGNSGDAPGNSGNAPGNGNGNGNGNAGGNGPGARGAATGVGAPAGSGAAPGAAKGPGGR
ncbi:hypothetical protein C5C27_01980 [Rathayibacter sp. AY2B7]|uniref:hypothetical protein n=1 Tax=Rathayibacter sp. AY2B7 TaxID=2080571 RepID=UPI000CE8CD16|nr:hypothetical protein [Rathayibacter sp. AY2B7]PPG64815.1 hypothetical protein C5C27_01980 [Rathayibacter sp. AY2B7]